MRKLIIVLAILALAVGVASAKQSLYEPRDIRVPGRTSEIFWFDDLEPQPDDGWTHGDATATAVPHFHVDPYLAYSGTFSWWCGTFAYDADGGYGNSWDDRLNVPPTPWPAGAYEVMTFAYRNDTEPAYDFSYVDAESLGNFVHLSRGFDGVHPWGTTGFYVGNKDNPTVARFRFVSDGAWSDEDGNYLSVGGAFMCDEIHIWDYYTGNVHFYDDVETGGLCTPGVPAAAGDYWHIVSDDCLAFSDPNVWACFEWNTWVVPPNVQNWLMTPMVDIVGATTCTTGFVIQFFVPTVGNDYWTEEVTVDGGASWTQLHCLWGDQCAYGYSPCDHFMGGDDVTSLLPGTQLALRWTICADGNGVGPSACTIPPPWQPPTAVTIDNVGASGYTGVVPVEKSSWGRVKSMYR